jgi:hypothetical protein
MDNKDLVLNQYVESCEWINVKDKLPNERTCVICFIDCKNVDRTRNNVEDSVGVGYISTDITGEQYWSAFYNPTCNYFGYLPSSKENIWGKVTHWMLLPESPKKNKLKPIVS